MGNTARSFISDTTATGQRSLKVYHVRRLIEKLERRRIVAELWNEQSFENYPLEERRSRHRDNNASAPMFAEVI
jgi:hypothetical protein